MKLYARANQMDLRCSQGHEHLVRNHCIEESDWKHLLKEFPEYLFRDNPSSASRTDVVMDIAESDEGE